MSAILMTVESVRTRASTSEALLTLAVPLEQGAAISAFLGKIGQQIGVAFADLNGQPLTEKQTTERGSNWRNLGPLAQSAIKVCQEPEFQAFAATVSIDPPSEDLAARFLKSVCNVTTRKDLDNMDGARELFGSLMAQYRTWLAKRT